LLDESTAATLEQMSAAQKKTYSITFDYDDHNLAGFSGISAFDNAFCIHFDS
jgi:hypothetical protein